MTEKKKEESTLMERFTKLKGKSKNFLRDVMEGLTPTVKEIDPELIIKKKKKKEKKEKITIGLNPKGLLSAEYERKKKQQEIMKEINKKY